MHSKTWARTRGAVQWNTGRSSRSTVFSERQACSTRISDETGIFELLLLLDGITAFDHRAAERDPVEEIGLRHVAEFCFSGDCFGIDSTNERPYFG